MGGGKEKKKKGEGSDIEVVIGELFQFSRIQCRCLALFNIGLYLPSIRWSFIHNIDA